MNELQTRPTPRRDLSRIPFTWERTTAPEMPFRLPIYVEMNVVQDSIQIHAVRRVKGTMGELMGMDTDVDMNLQFHKDEILSVEIFLMPDVPDDADWSWVGENDLSWIFIRHRDAFGVEPYFVSQFTSDKAYWPKALAKLLKERAGIDSKVVQETKETRKVRLIR